MKSKDDIILEGLYINLLEEAKKKKKVNPWAIAKSMAKKKGFGPKKEEEVVKGIKKGAKKAGAKITSEPVEEAFYPGEDIFEKYEEVGMSAEMALDAMISASTKDILGAPLQDQKALQEAVRELWRERIEQWDLSDWSNTVSL